VVDQNYISDWVVSLPSERGEHISLRGVSWWYGMAHSLFLAVENLRQSHGSPQHQGSVWHLVYASALYNKRMHATADTSYVIISRGAARRVMRGVRPLPKSATAAPTYVFKRHCVRVRTQLEWSACLP
jgi:hypothetical protein